MKTDLLKLLIEATKEIDPATFDMGTYGTEGHTCISVGCICGHATTDPKVRQYVLDYYYGASFGDRPTDDLYLVGEVVDDLLQNELGMQLGCSITCSSSRIRKYALHVMKDNDQATPFYSLLDHPHVNSPSTPGVAVHYMSKVLALVEQSE